MTVPFSLSVPADARYRVLAPEVAAKYVELAGGTSKDAAAVAAAVSHVLGDLAADGGDLHLSFHVESGGVHVTVRGAGRSTVVKHPLPARKH